jgi:hypothetical protein
MRGAVCLLVVAATACGPPEPSHLVLSVGATGGPYGKDVFVDVGVATDIEAEIVNDGASAAVAPQLTFSELACLTIVPDFDVDRVEPGARATFGVNVTGERDCHVTTIVDWFLDTDDASSRGTFNVILNP